VEGRARRRLGLAPAVEWRDVLVDGVADEGSRRGVIARHPQGEPRAILDEVIAAYGRGE